MAGRHDPRTTGGLTDGNLTQTQALFGQRVVVLATRGDWYEVAVPGRPNPKNPAGYPGWIPRDQVRTNAGFAAAATDRPLALVDGGTATPLFDDPALTRPGLEISINIAMYVGGGRMIEAYDHLTPVRTTPARLAGDSWGAVRHLSR